MNVILKDIYKSYGQKEIIKGIDLEINSGELISLLGPSGCGKSTTLFMIAGLEDITKGKLFFGDKDVTDVSPDKREIGLVFQNYALYPHFSVLKNVMYPIQNQGVKKDEAKKRAMEVIKSVELEEHIDKLPSQLSGGQQQRVAIARAIAKNPKVLLLDEPISNLDAKLKEQTSKEIRNIQKKYGITTIFVTHDQQEALAISDRIVVLDEGKIMQIGTPNELYRDPKHLHVAKFIGTPGINIMDIQIKNGEVVGFENLINDKLNILDGKYKLGIRPEYINIVPNTGINCDVESVKLLGRDIQVTIDLNGEKLEVISRKAIDEINEKENIEVEANKIYLFDDKGERVL